jgi:GxxExxY protein
LKELITFDNFKQKRYKRKHKMRDKRLTKKYLTDLTYQITGAAIEVHKKLGPGLLESVYHKCLMHELSLRNISYTSECSVSVIYKGLDVDTRLRYDLYVDEVIVVELKAVDLFHPIHEAKLLTYMRLLDAPKGILINFNVVNLYRDGQKTFVNDLFRNIPEE